MRRVFSGLFWIGVDTKIWKAAVCCLMLTLIWSLISGWLYFFEGERSYFEIKAVLQFKIVLAAVVFLGRYLLFYKYRKPKWFKWFFGLFFLLGICAQGWGLFKTNSYWVYLLLKICDLAIWGIFIAGCLEFFGAWLIFWRGAEKVNISQLNQLWSVIGQETLAIGLFLTFLAGLCYYYLMSFYLVDTLLYSYLLLIPVLTVGLGFFIAAGSKVNGWLRQDLDSLDREIAGYLRWQDYQMEPELSQKLPWLEYLTLIRNYLAQTYRPRLYWKILCSYFICSGFILLLPYIFGLVIEVGSFK